MSLKNFLDSSETEKKEHRARSASAMFQKGIYHLYVTKSVKFTDEFDKTLRLYQCIFLLSAAQLLLDFEGEKFFVKGKKVEERINRDPGVSIIHSQIEKWLGFDDKHPLYKVGTDTKKLYLRIHEARHNMIYRPYFESHTTRFYWEDCTLESLLHNIPNVTDVEQTYKNFYQSLCNWMKQSLENRNFENYKFLNSFELGLKEPLSSPPVSLLLNYARTLNYRHESNIEWPKLDEIRKYRNSLLDIEIEEIYLDEKLK